jgi:hypothetical protein
MHILFVCFSSTLPSLGSLENTGVVLLCLTLGVAQLSLQYLFSVSSSSLRLFLFWVAVDIQYADCCPFGFVLGFLNQVVFGLGYGSQWK